MLPVTLTKSPYSQIIERWALTLGAGSWKREVERGEAEGPWLFTVTQILCLSTSWRGGLTKGEASSVLHSPNFPSWQSLSHNSSQRGESLLPAVDDDKPAELRPGRLSLALFPLIGLSAPPPMSPPTNSRKRTGVVTFVWMWAGKYMFYFYCCRGLQPWVWLF